MDSVLLILKSSWSNLFIVLCLIGFLYYMYKNQKIKESAYLSFSFLSLILLNCLSAYTHSFERNPDIISISDQMYNLMCYFQYAGLGLIAFFFEYYFINRVKNLYQIKIIKNFNNKILNMMKLLAFSKLIIFQIVNYVYLTYNKPNFFIAILDYSFSFVIITLGTLIISYRIKKTEKNFSNNFEKFLGFGCFSIIIISFIIQQNPIIKNMFPYTNHTWITSDDIFHVVVTLCFYLLYKSSFYLSEFYKKNNN